MTDKTAPAPPTRGEDREKIARIVDPKAWQWHDEHLARAQEWSDKGKPDDHALVGGYRKSAIVNVGPSLAKADAILSLLGEAGR